MPRLPPISSAGVIDALPSAALILDGDAVVVAVNRIWRDSPEGCFGMTESVLPGLNLLAGMNASAQAASDDAQSMIRGLVDVVDGTREVFAKQFACGPVAHPETHWMRVELSAFIEADGQRMVLLTRQDVTAEYRIDRALLESESRYHAVVEHQLELISRFLPDTTLTFVNQSYCDYFGKPREQLLGRKFLELIPENEWAAIIENLAAFTPEDNTSTYEHPVLRPDGSAGWQSWTDRAFFDKEGQLIEFQSVGRDITHLKQAQEALRESQTRFNQLADHLDGVFWIFEWQTRKMVYLSPAFERVFARSPQDVMNDPKQWIESVHPEDRGHVLNVFRGADHQPFDLTYRILRPGGEERWVRDRGYPVHDDSGRVVRLAGLAEDVTERVLDQQKVQRSEDRYRAASEAGLDAFYLLDALRDDQGEIVDFVFTDINQRGADLVSRQRSEVIGQRLCELLPVNNDEMFLGEYKRVAETGEGLSRDFRIDAAEDGILANWLEQQVVRVGDGIAISTRDISARKCDEQEIVRQREENQFILDAIPAMVFYKDANNRILRVNRAVCEAMNLPADQIEGTHSAEFFPLDAEAFYEDDMAVIQSGKPKLGYIEHIGKTKDSERWVRTDKVPLYDAERNPVGVIAISMDVTELKHTSERLEQSERRYRGLFDRVPVSVWELDLLAVGAWLEELRRREVVDLPSYLQEHPDAITHAKRLIEIKGVNQATFELMGASDLESLTQLLNDARLGPPPERLALKLQTIWNGRRSAEMETYCYTVDGKKIEVLFRLEIPEVDGHLDLSRAIVALTDISANKQRLFAQAQVTQAQRERLILGHELHDTLAQQLTGINMLTESLRRRLASQNIPEAERVAELAGMVGQANSEVRRLISGLSAERIAAHEIETALESLAERSALVHQLPITFHCLRTPDELDEEAANHLLFIAQEATHNAAKHAQASSIQITLDQDEDALTLIVHDDGVGLPPADQCTATPESGLGLGIMRYRAEAIGATMTIDASPQAGTTVNCSLPTAEVLAAVNPARHTDPSGVSKDD